MVKIWMVKFGEPPVTCTVIRQIHQGFPSTKNSHYMVQYCLLAIDRPPFMMLMVFQIVNQKSFSRLSVQKLTAI